MILFIDTSDLKKVRFALIPQNKGAIKSKTVAVPYRENYRTLEHLEKFLQTHGIAATQLKKIVISSGPGSFTGLRVGASLAMGLSFGLDIPFVAIKKAQIPKNLSNLVKIKSRTKFNIDYGKPAVY